MFCENCGSKLDDFSGVCPNCNVVTGGQQFSGDSFNTQYYQQPVQEIKTTGILVWSIIELLCVNMIAGIIALILYFTQLKPAAEKGDINGAQKSKKTIKIILWIGIGLWILVFLASIAILALNVAAVANTTKGLGDSGYDKINDLQSILENDSSYVDYYDYDYDDYYSDYDF